MKNIIIAISIISIALLYSMCDDIDMYSLAKYGPKPDGIYIFFQSADDPPVGSTGLLGSMYDMDRQCALGANTIPHLMNIPRVKTFISFEERNIKDLIPEVFGDTPVYGIMRNTNVPIIIINSWESLWRDYTITPYLSGKLTDTMGLSANWWSGSTANGTYESASSCNNWQTGSNSFFGRTGNGGSDNGTWIYNSTTSPCNVQNFVLCIAY